MEQTSPIFKIESKKFSLNNEIPDLIPLDIKVQNFQELRSVKLTLEFDLNHLEIVEIIKNPNLVGGFSTSLTTPPQATEFQGGQNQVILSWFTFPPTSLNDGEIFVTLKVKLKTNEPNKYNIKFNNDTAFTCRSFGNRYVNDDPNLPPNLVLMEIPDIPYIKHYIDGEIELYNTSTSQTTNQGSSQNSNNMNKRIDFTYGDIQTTQLNKGNKFHLPFKALENLTLSAISMIIEYPSDYISVKSIALVKDDEPVVDGNFQWATPSTDELRIGWFAGNNMIQTKTNEDFMLVEVEIIKDFEQGQELKIGMKDDILVEFAGSNYEPILPIVNIETIILKHDSQSSTIPTEPQFPPGSRVGERKDLMNYSAKPFNGTCSTCYYHEINPVSGRYICNLGNFSVARGGRCDWYIKEA